MYIWNLTSYYEVYAWKQCIPLSPAGGSSIQKLDT